MNTYRIIITAMVVGLICSTSFSDLASASNNPGQGKKVFGFIRGKATGAAGNLAGKAAAAGGELAMEQGKKIAKKVHYTVAQKMLQKLHRYFTQLGSGEKDYATVQRQLCGQGKPGFAGCTSLTQLISDKDMVPPRSCKGLIFKAFPTLIDPYVKFCSRYVGPGSNGPMTTIFESGAGQYFDKTKYPEQVRNAKEAKESMEAQARGQAASSVMAMLASPETKRALADLEAATRSSLILEKIPFDDSSIDSEEMLLQ